jgi:uracil-DNA glycosylase
MKREGISALSDSLTQKPTPFNPECRLCPRLVSYRNAERRVYPDYFNAPVPPFGDSNPRLMIVGLAPGFHGANASGRPFTGDHAGLILYRNLFEFGFASKPESTSRDDGLVLKGCRITNSVKCVPPENKPLPGEIRLCSRYLVSELQALPPRAVILVLGVVAHKATLEAMGESHVKFKFAHGKEYALANDITMIDSLHTSRYNTQTKRLTEEMFRAVMKRARELVDGGK